MRKVYTSEEILEADELYEIQEKCVIKYEMTEAELQWLDFVKGRYTIADYLLDNLEENTVSIDALDVSNALDADCEGFGKAVMLSDDTALQRILFWIYQPS